MIAAGVIGGIYLLGIIILFLGVKEKDGKIYLNMPRFANNYFIVVSGKDCYLSVLFLLDPYALSSDRAIPFCKGLGLTMKHGPYVKLTASFLLISTAVQVTSVSKAVCWPHSSPSMRESEAAKMQITFDLCLEVMIKGVVSSPRNQQGTRAFFWCLGF